MHGERGEEAHDVEREEGMTGLLAVRGDDAVVASEVARWEAVELELELEGYVSRDAMQEDFKRPTSLMSAGQPPALYAVRCRP